MTSRPDPRLKDLARREANRLRDEAIDRLWHRLVQALRPARTSEAKPCHS